CRARIDDLAGFAALQLGQQLIPLDQPGGICAERGSLCLHLPLVALELAVRRHIRLPAAIEQPDVLEAPVTQHPPDSSRIDLSGVADNDDGLLAINSQRPDPLHPVGLSLALVDCLAPGFEVDPSRSRNVARKIVLPWPDIDNIELARIPSKLSSLDEHR